MSKEMSLEEIRQTLAEVAVLQKEMQVANIELQATNREMQVANKEMQVANKEIQTAQKATDKQLKELGKQIGGIGEKFGSFTEGLAYPSMRKHLYKKYSIDNTVANYLRRLPTGEYLELDAFGFTNGDINTAVVVEVKSHLQSKHIYEFVKELKDFRANFPDFKDKKLYAILATVRVVSKELRQEIFENGLHLAIIHDDVFDLDDNPKALNFNA